MAQPMKLSFTQGVMETSALKREILGSLRILADGRKFRYARAGAAALAAGNLITAPRADAGHLNQAASAAEVGDRILALTVAGAVLENDYEDGCLQINDGDGEGHQYRILSNGACDDGEVVVLTLAEPLREALTASSKFTLVRSPWAEAAVSADEKNPPVGVTPCGVRAGRYFWAQTGGPGLCLASDASDVGTMLVPGATAGSLAGMNASLDVDRPIVAVAMAAAGVAGQYKPCFLKID